MRDHSAAASAKSLLHGAARRLDTLDPVSQLGDVLDESLVPAGRRRRLPRDPHARAAVQRVGRRDPGVRPAARRPVGEPERSSGDGDRHHPPPDGAQLRPPGRPLARRASSRSRPPSAGGRRPGARRSQRLRPRRGARVGPAHGVGAAADGRAARAAAPGGAERAGDGAGPAPGRLHHQHDAARRQPAGDVRGAAGAFARAAGAAHAAARARAPAREPGQRCGPAARGALRPAAELGDDHGRRVAGGRRGCASTSTSTRSPTRRRRSRGCCGSR